MQKSEQLHNDLSTKAQQKENDVTIEVVAETAINQPNQDLIEVTQVCSSRNEATEDQQQTEIKPAVAK